MNESIERLQRDINRVDNRLERVDSELKGLLDRYKSSDADEKQRILPDMKRKTEEKNDLKNEKMELHAELSAEIEDSTGMGVDDDLDEVLHESKVRDKIAKIVELMTRKHLRETGNCSNKNKKSKIKEYNDKYSITAIEEFADDLIIGVDMLIDSHYGEVDSVEFKRMWEKLALQFQDKVGGIIKQGIKS